MDYKIIKDNNGKKYYIIYETIFGSKMYGTATENSDTDIKGIFLPTKKECYLNKITNSFKISTVGENDTCSKDDIEKEYYSLQYFLQLAYNGQTVAMDILYGPEASALFKSPLVSFIFKNKDNFVTKKLTALIGYAKGQAIKYSNKGNILNAFIYLNDKLTNYIAINNIHTKSNIKNLYNELSDVIKLYPNIFSFRNKMNKDFFCMNSKEFQLDMQIENLMDSLNASIGRYGNRTKTAASADGSDFKALSHALRCMYCAKELYTKKIFTYPLPQNDYIFSVKKGEIPYDDIIISIDNLYNEVIELANNSIYPNEVDTTIFEKYIMDLYNNIEDENING
jgi:predicted nucleotidyltransferase